MRVTVLVSAAALAVVACAGGDRKEPTAVTVNEPVVETAEDDAWVSFSGTVTRTKDDGEFTVDYGTGSIAVEMDDWEWYPKAAYLLVNDKVVVYGQIDEDFFESRTVDGYAVYVADLDTQFFTDSAASSAVPIFTALEDDPSIELRGTVKYISGDRFMLDTGRGVVEVATDALPYDPLDDSGYQQLSLGDRVRVVGDLTTGFFADKELMATALITERY